MADGFRCPQGPLGSFHERLCFHIFLALSVEVIKLWQLPNLSVSLFFQMERVGREGRGQAPLLKDSIQCLPLKMIPFLVGPVPGWSHS